MIHDKPPHDVSFSVEDLRRYFGARGGHGGICIECGANDWTAQGTTSDSIPFVGVNIQTFPISNSSLPLVFLICKNCGFVKMFARTKIIDWLAKEQR